MEEQGAACLPRVVRSLKEIEALRRESESMSDMIDFLQNGIGNLQVESSNSVRAVSELEVIKRRMDSCSGVLLQADRFKVLLQSMDEVYESGDVPRMSAALSALVSSFSNLSNLTEFEGDKALIARYTERLEALVKPKMIKAFESHDTKHALTCIATFRQIERADQITLVYHKLFNQKALSLWQRFDPPQPTAPKDTSTGTKTPQSSTPQPGNLPASTSNPASQPSKPIDSWITTFYTQLAELFKEEVAWTPNIFPDAPTAIAKLLISALTQQSALMDSHLRKLDILRLTSTYAATKSFATSIDFFVQPLGPGLRLQVFQSLFAPFRKYQSQYAVFESQFIDSGLGASATISLTTDAAGSLKALTNFSTSLFALLQTSTDHCIRFTEAAEAEALHRLIQARLTSLADLSTQTLQKLRAALLGPKASHNTSSYDSTEWCEESFLQAISATKVAASLINQLRRLSAHFRSQILAQKPTLFGDETLESVIERQEQVTSNLFLYQPAESVKALAKLLLVLEDPSQDPFAKGTSLITGFASQAQFIVFETMFGFIRHQLATTSKLPAFAKDSVSGTPAAQSYIKQVVEHFLILPQVMESMEHEGEETSTDDVTFLTLPVRPFAIAGSPKHLGLAPSASAIPEEEEQSSGFSGDWMEIIARETQLLLASSIIQIPHLTAAGVQQLDADIMHLYSVLSVLGLEQEPLLEQILEYCHVPTAEFSTLLSETNDLERKKMLILLGRARRVLPANPAPTK